MTDLHLLHLVTVTWALSTWSPHVCLWTFSHLPLKVGPVLLALAALRSITLQVLCVASRVLDSLTRRCSWVPRLTSHLGLCWLQHLAVVTKDRVSSSHLRVHLVRVSCSFNWALATPTYWLSTLPLVNTLAHVALVSGLTQVLRPALLVIQLVHLLDLVGAHDAAPEDAVVGGFDSTEDLSLVPLMHASWTSMYLIWVGILACAASNVHIRACNSSRSHVVEHYWTFRVPSSLLVQRGADPTSAELSCSVA